MSRLWQVSQAACLPATVALAHGVVRSASLWPAVALFCLAGVLACVAAAVDASIESAKHEAELDKQCSHQDVVERLDIMSQRLVQAEAKVAHLEKKDALNALG